MKLRALTGRSDTESRPDWCGRCAGVRSSDHRQARPDQDLRAERYAVAVKNLNDVAVTAGAAPRDAGPDRPRAPIEVRPRSDGTKRRRSCSTATLRRSCGRISW